MSLAASGAFDPTRNKILADDQEVGLPSRLERYGSFTGVSADVLTPLVTLPHFRRFANIEDESPPKPL